MDTDLVKAGCEALMDALWPEGTWAQGLTCTEAEAVGDMIASVLDDDAHRTFLQAHSLGDSDEEDEHHELGRKTAELGIGWC